MEGITNAENDERRSMRSIPNSPSKRKATCQSRSPSPSASASDSIPISVTTAESASSSVQRTHIRGGIFAECDLGNAFPATQKSTVEKSTREKIQQRVQTPAAKPIDIDRPGKKSRQFHTPLSARGDLIGGYFPLHEASQRSLETHPFNRPALTPDYHSEMHAGSLSTTPAAMEDYDFNARAREIPQTPPVVSMPPLGKYHPANYQNKTPSITLQPPQPQPSPRPLLSRTTSSTSSQHERSKSDVKKSKQLLQKYQRDMVEQATRAARRAGATIEDPARAPKLAPLGSPGPVTPMELEESATGGYLVAGASRESRYRQGENREADMVGRMIRAEEERRRREGQSSPLATAGGN